MRLVSFILFAIAMVPAASAQTYDVTGVVVDSSGVPLPGATVVAITASDSTLTSFGTTRREGDFQLRRVPSGEFVLQVSFVGFNTYSAPFSVSSGDVDLGTITMSTRVSELGELVVTEERIPIVVKEDTVVYDASAFKVRPYATVEELLKRLPGIEVARDGTVTAQGEQVQKVLVDGKEFFGDDPKIATKNLPAEAVQRVEVFDKKSDIAEFTGVDDGEQQKTINLELKEDHRQGYFGDISAAYGADNHYDGSANINRFSTSTQMALIGNISNVENERFSVVEFADLAMVVGGFGGGGGGGGLSTTASGGFNFSHDFNPRTSIRSSYFLNHSDNTQDRELLQQQLFGNTLGSLMEETSNRESINFNHRLNLDVEHEFTPTKELRFRLRGQMSDSETESVTRSKTSDTESVPVNNSETRHNTQSDRLNGNARLTYMHRFGESRRNLVAEVRGDMSDQDGDADLASITDYFQDGSVLTTEELNQLQNSLSNDLTASARLSFTQPLGGVRLLELRAERRQTFEDRTQDIFDRVGSDLVFNDSLSSGFDRTYTYNEARATLRWDREDSDLSIGASVENSNLNGEISDFGVPVDKSYIHILPEAYFRAEVGRGMNLNIRYSANTREPSIQQLQPVVDNSNPLRIYVGNPDLNPEYSHRLNSYFRWFDQFSFMNVFLSMNASYTKNQIVNARTVDEQFRQTVTPINADGDWSLGGSGSFGTPIRPLGVQINVGNQTSYGRSTEFVNGAENDTRTLRNSINLRVENRNKDFFDAGLGTRYTFNVNNYSLNTELNQSYVNRSYFADLAITPDDKWRFSTGFDLSLNSEAIFGSSRNVAMWNAEISRSLLQNNRAQIILTGRDLLNQSVGVDYTNAAGFVRQEEVRSLGRYFMLKFVYNLSANPGGGGRGRAIRIG